MKHLLTYVNLQQPDGYMEPSHAFYHFIMTTINQLMCTNMDDSVPCRGTGRGRVPPRHTPGAAALNGLSRSLAGFPNVVCLG